MPDPPSTSSPAPQSAAPGIGAPITIAGIAGVIGVAIANIEKLEPFLEKQGMNALIVLTGLGMVVTAVVKLVPALEQLIASARENHEKLSLNYTNQTTILSRMDERQGRDSTKIDDLHRQIVVRGGSHAEPT